MVYTACQHPPAGEAARRFTESERSEDSAFFAHVFAASGARSAPEREKGGFETLTRPIRLE